MTGAFGRPGRWPRRPLLSGAWTIFVLLIIQTTPVSGVEGTPESVSARLSTYEDTDDIKDLDQTMTKFIAAGEDPFDLQTLGRAARIQLDRELERGERRQLALCTRVGDTHEQAVNAVRNGHDEFWKFLGPYGWSKGYMGPDGKPAKPGLIPTLEESIDNKTWVVGTAEEVAETIRWFDDQIGLENLLLFPAMPGDSYSDTAEQVQRISEGVLPLI